MADLPELGVFQALLAKTLRLAIESDGFVERFQSDDAVRRYWPVE